MILVKVTTRSRTYLILLQLILVIAWLLVQSTINLCVITEHFDFPSPLDEENLVPLVNSMRSNAITG